MGFGLKTHPVKIENDVFFTTKTGAYVIGGGRNVGRSSIAGFISGLDALTKQLPFDPKDNPLYRFIKHKRKE